MAKLKPRSSAKRIVKAVQGVTRGGVRTGTIPKKQFTPKQRNQLASIARNMRVTRPGVSGLHGKAGVKFRVKRLLRLQK